MFEQPESGLPLKAVGRVRERASGIGAEVRMTAVPGIAVARGWMSTTSHVPDAAFR